MFRRKKCFIGKKVFDKNIRVFVAWNISPVFVTRHNRTEISDRPAVFVQPNSSRSMCVFRLPRSKGDSTLRLDATPYEGRINSFTWKKRVQGLCGVGASLCADTSHRMWGEFAIKWCISNFIRGMYVCIVSLSGSREQRDGDYGRRLTRTRRESFGR